MQSQQKVLQLGIATAPLRILLSRAAPQKKMSMSYNQLHKQTNEIHNAYIIQFIEGNMIMDDYKLYNNLFFFIFPNIYLGIA